MTITTLHDRQLIYRQALYRFGKQAQLVQAMEELGELQVEIAKHINMRRRTTEELVDEIADVRIMIEQIEMILNIEDKVSEKIDKKIERLFSRLFP